MNSNNAPRIPPLESSNSSGFSNQYPMSSVNTIEMDMQRTQQGNVESYNFWKYQPASSAEQFQQSKGGAFSTNWGSNKQ